MGLCRVSQVIGSSRYLQGTKQALKKGQQANCGLVSISM